MKFLSIRELRSSTSQLKDFLSNDGKIVLTTNGKPAALIIEVNEDTLEQTLLDIRIAQARRAIREMQEQSVRSGLDKMTLEEINEEIDAARRERDMA